jgi:predicted aminopeptidase
MHLNHEGYSYVYRIQVFLDLLRAGYVFPHWVVDFRDGLGSPYFGYYQPGFFYLASAFAAVLPMPTALAATLTTLALIGYGGVFAVVRARFGAPAGALAGTTLLASSYVYQELYWRGDLSEFTGMMLLPVALHCVTSWLDTGRWRYLNALAVTAAALLCAHPVAGLLGFGALVTVGTCWTAMGGDRSRAAMAVGALVVAIGLAGFYLAAVVLEWDLVQGDRLRAAFDFRQYFVTLPELLNLRPRTRPMIEVGFSWITLVLAAFGLATSLVSWPRLTPAQRRLVVSLVVLAAGSLWIMHSTSIVLWETFPPLTFLQFPWRALLVVTVVMSLLAGCVARGAAILPLLGVALPVYVLFRIPIPAMAEHPYSDDPRRIADRFVAPDAAGEWLPVGATRFLPKALPREPMCDGCVVTDYERTAGRLRMSVTTSAPSASVVLPHYFFPVGWSATSAGQPTSIEPTEQRLMRVEVRGDGIVDVRFGTTPARRAGAIVSGVTVLAIVLGVLGRLAFRRRAAASLAVAMLALAATGCGTAGYLLQSGLAEARILWRREPIAHVLARPDLEANLRERLRLVLEVRRFAEDPLGLRVGDSFSTFADVDGSAVVWVVSAARRDRLEAYTWWYPVVGRVPYQGFFERDAAERAARALQAKGFDVDVRPASAFSTLGWFADPLLSSTAKAGPVRLTETVIHELFHATLYVPGATVFNESAATFVGHRGAIAFFCGGPGDDAERCAEAAREWRTLRAHAQLLDRYARRLRALYARAPAVRVRERARTRLAAVATRALVRRGLGAAEELSPPNNARLLSMLAYETDLETFEQLAPGDTGLAGAIGRIVGAARGAVRPFEAVRALQTDTLQTERTRLDSEPPWRLLHSPSTSCSDGSPAGSASSGTTLPMGRICTATDWSPARGARGGPS